MAAAGQLAVTSAWHIHSHFLFLLYYPAYRNQKKDQDVMTIKCGLKSFLTNDENGGLKGKFEETVLEVSPWMVEVSLYVHFKINKLLSDNNQDAIFAEFQVNNSNKKFLDEFYELSIDNGKTKSNYQIDKDYEKIRNKFNLPLYNRSGKGNTFNFAAETFLTNFKNNIWMHGYTRIKGFLRHMHPDIDNFDTMDYLFNEKSNRTPNDTLLTTIKKQLIPPDNSFRSIKKNWYGYVPTFWKLQRIYEVHKIRNFRLVPQFSHGRKSVRFDTQTMHALRNSYKPKSIPHKERSTKELVWPKDLFAYEKFESSYQENGETKSGRRFDFSITTDGIAVSLKMERFKEDKGEDTEKSAENFRGIVVDKLKKAKYERIIGNDPGMKSPIYLNAVHLETGEQTRTNYSARTFRHESGEFHRKGKMMLLTLEAIIKKEEDRKVFALTPPSPKLAEYLDTFKNVLPAVKVKEKKKKENTTKVDSTANDAKPKPKPMSKYAKKRARIQKAKRERGEETAPPPPNVDEPPNEYQLAAQRWKRTRTEIDEDHQYQLSAMSWNFRDFIEFQLKHFAEMQKVMSQASVARLKFHKYICVDKLCHRLAKEVSSTGKIELANNNVVRYKHRIGKLKFRTYEVSAHVRNQFSTLSIFIHSIFPSYFHIFINNIAVKPLSRHDKKTLFFQGSARFGPCIKGHVRVPLPKFSKYMRMYSDVIEIDEYCTTKRCTFCSEQNRSEDMHIPPSPHRFLHCKKCKKTIHRDNNGARNIRVIGTAVMEGKERPGAFKRPATVEAKPNRKRKPAPKSSESNRKVQTPIHH